MMREDIDAMLNGKLAPGHLLAQYEGEIARYDSGLKVDGGVAPVLLEGDGSICVNKSGLIGFFKSYLCGDAIDALFRYVLDAISLDQGVSYESDQVREIVLDLSDAERSANMRLLVFDALDELGSSSLGD